MLIYSPACEIGIKTIDLKMMSNTYLGHIMVLALINIDNLKILTVITEGNFYICCAHLLDMQEGISNDEPTIELYITSDVFLPTTPTFVFLTTKGTAKLYYSHTKLLFAFLTLRSTLFSCIRLLD